MKAQLKNKIDEAIRKLKNAKMFLGDEIVDNTTLAEDNVIEAADILEDLIFDFNIYQESQNP